MPIKDHRQIRGGPIDPVIIADTDQGVVFIPGLTSIFTVGDLQGPVTVEATELIITKPATATYLQLQTLFQNIRYTTDDSEATSTHGFQLTAGAIVPVPVPNGRVRVFREGVGAILQYQWMRSR